MAVNWGVASSDCLLLLSWCNVVVHVWGQFEPKPKRCKINVERMKFVEIDPKLWSANCLIKLAQLQLSLMILSCGCNNLQSSHLKYLAARMAAVFKAGEEPTDNDSAWSAVLPFSPVPCVDKRTSWFMKRSRVNGRNGLSLFAEGPPNFCVESSNEKRGKGSGQVLKVREPITGLSL